MNGLVASVRQLFNRRAALLTEIAHIDTELEEVRGLLDEIVPQAATEDVPIEKACELCGKTYPQRSNRQKICAACRAEAPHRAVSEQAEAVSDAPTPPLRAKDYHVTATCDPLPVTDDRAVLEQRVLQALKSGPMRPVEVYRATGGLEHHVRETVVEMERKGLVVITGKTAARRVALASRAPAKAAPTTPEAFARAFEAVGRTPPPLRPETLGDAVVASAVKERDAKILAALARRSMTLDELVAMLARDSQNPLSDLERTDLQQAARRATIRLRAMNKIQLAADAATWELTA